MDVQDRFKNARIVAGLSRAQLAGLVGVSPSSISNYENGISFPKYDIITSILQALNISANYIFQTGSPSNSDVLLTSHEQTQVRKYRETDPRGKETVDRVLDYEHNRSTGMTDETPKSSINVYAESAAAGFGDYLFTSDFDGMEFPARDIPTGTDYGVRISGSSMEPEIPDGCIVFVRACPAIESGQIGIFSLNNHGLCKRLEVNHDHRKIRLLSTNPAYEPLDIRQYDDLRTFGQVLGFTKNIKNI